MTNLPPHAVRHVARQVNLLHATLFFSPDLDTEFGKLGFTDPSAMRLAARSAPLGAVGAGTVAATFYNYNHELLARHLPAVWETASPAAVLDARLRTVDATLRRLLGDEAVTSPGMAEAATLALRAAEACTRHARPLYAGNADLPVPDEDTPHLRLWHATTLLREHRGDGHLVALLSAGLGPVEALVSHTATGKGMSPRWVLGTRGWGRADWDAAVERLRERGLLDADGELTEAGVALREHLEDETDRLDSAPYEHLGADGTARLTELVKGFLTAAVGAGAFPADLSGKA
ncbi:SCO6745 family protein [Streptomyces sp. NPDC003943]